MSKVEEVQDVVGKAKSVLDQLTDLLSVVADEKQRAIDNSNAAKQLKLELENEIAVLKEDKQKIKKVVNVVKLSEEAALMKAAATKLNMDAYQAIQNAEEKEKSLLKEKAKFETYRNNEEAELVVKRRELVELKKELEEKEKNMENDLIKRIVMR